MASGAVASTITVLKTILSCTGCNCIRVASVTFGGISKVAIVGNGTAGTCGIRVEAGTMACTAPVGISNFAEGFSCLSGMLYAISSVSSGSTSYGYHSNLGGAIVATYGVASGNAIGFVAEQGSTLAADQGQSVGNTSHGFQAIATSFMVCGSAWSTGNGGAGFYAAGHSQVNAAGSNASYCGADGFAADYASVADFSSTNSSYNPTGMSAHTLAMINATSTTIQHNTTGVYADQMAMLNASTSTIDNTNTTISSPAFNTQGNTFAYIVKS
jgi:hypothetical protein